MPTLPPALTDACIAHILRAQLTGTSAREAWLSPVLGDQPIYDNIDLNGAARPFAASVVRLLPHDQLIAALRGLRLGDVAATEALARQIEQHQLTPGPGDAPNPLLTAYRQRCMARWRDERYQLDKHFVRLIVLRQTEKGDHFEPRDAHIFQDLPELLAATPQRAVVLLGAPGSGKSTLLRQLQMDEARDRLADGGPGLSFFVPLNEYPDDAPDPRAWLASRWRDEPAAPGDFDALFNQGRLLLLLDALNEMPQRDAADYKRKVDGWRKLVTEVERKNNRAVFTCRSLDYSRPLSIGDTVVPNVTVKPLTDELVLQFLQKRIPDHAGLVYQQLQADERLLELYRTPYFLSLLVGLVDDAGNVPRGRADLFTRHVRSTLQRELKNGTLPLMLDALLDEDDRVQASAGRWSGYALPTGGVLFPRLEVLAAEMQQRQPGEKEAQISLTRADALKLLDHPNAADILKAGESLNLLDKTDDDAHRVRFFHQLLQEYFAARPLIQYPEKSVSLVRQKWRADDVDEPLRITLAGLKTDSEPLPKLPSTGWEETLRVAAAMVSDPGQLLRALMEANLPLAGEIAAAADMAERVSDALKNDLRLALVARSQDRQADLRARIAAGEALGNLGDDTRLRPSNGPHGAYRLPLLAKISGGDYTIGDSRFLARFRDGYANERPAKVVRLPEFEMGVFAVTNAEYKCFVEAGGYEARDWWDTTAAQKWLDGDTAEGPRQSWQQWRKGWLGTKDAAMQAHFIKLGRTAQQMEQLLEMKNESEEAFEQRMARWYKGGKQREPEYWSDPQFNNPAQPVVGVCWHEARAYCKWLSAQTGQHFRLPSEAEWEAAARGPAKREYAYAGGFDPYKGNTFESHIRKTTPVGVYPEGATPEGVHDLTGNVWEWTSSAYLPYPYKATPEREDATKEVERRVLRGGSWNNNHNNARAAYRNNNHPTNRNNNLGFRVVVSSALFE